MRSFVVAWIASVFIASTLSGCGLGGQYGIAGKPELRQDKYPRLRTTYDEFKDVTTTVSYSDLGHFKMLVLAATSPGRTAAPASFISLGIAEDSKSWKHQDPTLIFLVDGRRITATGLARLTSTGVDSRAGAYVTETVVTPMRADDLRVLGRASLIRGQLDTSEFALDADDMANLRAFAHQIGVAL